MSFSKTINFQGKIGNSTLPGGAVSVRGVLDLADSLLQTTLDLGLSLALQLVE